MWLASVLLVLLLISLAAAAILESTHSTKFAQAVLYKSWRVEALLAMLPVER